MPVTDVVAATVVAPVTDVGLTDIGGTNTPETPAFDEVEVEVEVEVEPVGWVDQFQFVEPEPEVEVEPETGIGWAITVFDHVGFVATGWLLPDQTDVAAVDEAG